MMGKFIKIVLIGLLLPIAINAAYFVGCGGDWLPKEVFNSVFGACVAVCLFIGIINVFIDLDDSF